MVAYIFPGQGAQFEGMGLDMYESEPRAKKIFEKSNELLGYCITDVMFYGSAEDLKATKITQPALFIHSYIKWYISELPTPKAVAGHSLGEITALAAASVLDFDSALMLVYERAMAMQDACDVQAGTMAAILGLEDQIVEGVCSNIKNDIVVAANYNCPGQIVISGTETAIDMAIQLCQEAGAKRALKLEVGGAFHSPLMQPAAERLERAIQSTIFNQPKCAVYQNVSTKAVMDSEMIKSNLINQLTGAVRWTQTIQNMHSDGITEFIEIGGNGKVLSGLVKKVQRDLITKSI